MKNKYLERELHREERIEHEIFENIDNKDLEILKEEIKKLPLTNVVVEFDMEKINNSKLLNMFEYGSPESIKIWDQFVVNQIWKSFYKREYDEREDLFYNKTLEEYKKEKNNLSTSDSYKLWINIVNMIVRLHFIIKGCQNKALYNAVSTYLDDKVYTTTIYCDDKFICKVKQDEYTEKQWLWDIYDYWIFDGFNEGMYSTKLRKEKIQPDKPKILFKVI